MPQVFGRSANSIARASLVALLIIIGGILLILYVLARSTYATQVGVDQPQPVPYSHKHHAGDEGFDCRYCHTTVEVSSFASVPATQICMNCHTQIWAQSPVLEPVRASYRNNTPLVWTRVHNLPDFVYFNHSIHVNKGIGCESCHGRVDQMPLTHKVYSLQMGWCLECHRNPEKYVRPVEFITTMGYQPQGDQATIGRDLVKRYGIQTRQSCSDCHR